MQETSQTGSAAGPGHEDAPAVSIPSPARRDRIPSVGGLRLVSSLDGEPIEGADVFLLPSAGDLVRIRSDASGEVALPSLRSPVEWLITLLGLEVEAGGGDLSEAGDALPLPAISNSVVSVWVDGSSLGEPISFFLEGVTAETSASPAIARSARAIFPEAFGVRTEVVARPGIGLELPAMPLHWEGFLRIGSPGFRFPGGESRLAVSAASFPRDLSLISQPAVLGRVVESGSGEPASDVLVGFLTVCAQGEQVGHVVTGPEGRFRIPFTCGPLLVADLTAVIPEKAYGRIRVEGEFHASVDVGDLMLAPGRSVRILVLGPDRRPLADAVAICAGLQSPRTDAEGMTILAGIPPRENEVRVYALGFKEGLAFLASADAEGVLEVVLEPAATLQIELRTPSGASPTRTRLALSAESALFDGPRPAAPHPVIAELGTATIKASRAQNWEGRIVASSLEVIPDSDGRAVLSGLAPETEITVRVLGVSGEILGQVPPVVLGDGEWRRLPVLLQREEQVFHGRCLSPAGEPVSGAIVQAGTASKPLRVVADEEGRFRLEGLLAESLDLMIEAKGYAPRVLQEVPLYAGAEDSPFSVTLMTGNPVLVKALDPEENLVALDQAEVWRGPFRIAREASAEDGTILFHSLPIGVVEIRTTLLGLPLVQRHDTGVSDLVFHVSGTGEILVLFPDPLESGRAFSLEVYRLDEPEHRILKRLEDESLASGRVLVAPLFAGDYGVRLHRFGGESEDPLFLVSRNPVPVPVGGRTTIRLEPPSEAGAEGSLE